MSTVGTGHSPTRELARNVLERAPPSSPPFEPQRAAQSQLRVDSLPEQPELGRHGGERKLRAKRERACSRSLALRPGARFAAESQPFVTGQLRFALARQPSAELRGRERHAPRHQLRIFARSAQRTGAVKFAAFPWLDSQRAAVAAEHAEEERGSAAARSRYGHVRKLERNEATTLRASTGRSAAARVRRHDVARIERDSRKTDATKRSEDPISDREPPQRAAGASAWLGRIVVVAGRYAEPIASAGASGHPEPTGFRAANACEAGQSSPFGKFSAYFHGAATKSRSLGIATRH